MRVAVDSSDDIYIADKKNLVVRKVDVSTGGITTYAGNGSVGCGTKGCTTYTGDGGAATAATFNEVNGLAFDSSDNLYIADTGIFPRCPSVNPMYTAMALARRQAHSIAERL